MGIRVIAVGDSVDTSKGEDDFVPLRNLFAEWYAKDTSKKIRAVLHSKGHSGKPLTNIAVYGYRKDPNDHNKWLVDETASPIVKWIFQMTVEGKRPYQIARMFTDEQIIRPSCHIARLNDCVTENSEATPYSWTDATITTIIRKAEYLGHTVNFKTQKPSFKSKRSKPRPQTEWEIFENTHEAIIDAATWETSQKCRTVKRRENKSGEVNPLTGLVYCGTCGSRMYNHRGTRYSETRPSQNSYCCTKYSKYPPECTRHNISVKSLRELVLKTIQSVGGYVQENEAEFVERLREASAIQQDEQAKSKKKQLTKDKRRVTELDTLIQRIYEDKVAGTLSDKRFAVLSKQYESEQETLEFRIAECESELEQFSYPLDCPKVLCYNMGYERVSNDF
jgi:DNA invertase Pin-like site-specific DNA recombinase